MEDPVRPSEDLIETARRGDLCARHEIGERIRQLSRHTCRFQSAEVGFDVDWEDVAQEASRVFFGRAIDNYTSMGSVNGYLYNVVRAVKLQMIRAAVRRRRREVQKDAPMEESPDTKTMANDRGPAQAEVWRILSLLDQACRDLLERVFLLGADYPELSKEMGIVESSIRSRVSRCIAKAREMAE